ncbi:hypothetical protein Pmani_009209 [Petrolisthes manimaculis]|uniref:Uncharacterized protein n=1 Tax=Petrolisthes manimaculis TaxID=1843537 RepID=A0AAE1Q4Q8_9EUCA|nr:hypothetical protein Pmani_009209 [Petrolisthes manimaculis]
MDGIGKATPRSQTKQVRTAHGDVVKRMKKRDTGYKSDAKLTQYSKINLGQRATTNPEIADILTNLQFLTIHIIDQDKHDSHNESLPSQLLYKTNLRTGGSNFGNGNYVFGLKTEGAAVKPQQNVHHQYGEGIQDRKLSIRQHQNVDQDTQSTKLRMKFIHTSSEPEHPTSFDQIPAGNQRQMSHPPFPIARQISYSTTSADRLPSPSNPISTFSPENGSLYPAQDSLHFPPFQQAPYSIIPSLNYTFFNDTPADASMTEASNSLGFNIFITPAPPISTPNLAHVSNLTYGFPSFTISAALSPTSDSQSSQKLQATLNTGAPAGNNQGKQTINPTSTSILTNQPIASSVYSLDMNKVLHQYAHQETTAPRPNHDHPSPPIKLSPTHQSIPHLNSSQQAALNQDLEDVKITEEGSNQSQEALLLALNLSQSLGPSDFLPENTPYVPAIHGGQFHEPVLPSLPQQSVLPAPDLLNLPELQSDFVSSFGAYSPQDCLRSRVCSIIASLSFVSATTFAFVIPILFPFLGRRRRRSVSPIHTFTKTLKGTDLNFFQKMMELSRNNNEPQVLEATEAIEEFLQQQHSQLLAMTLSKVPHPVPPSLLRHLTHGHLESLLVTLKDLMDTRHKAGVDAQSLTSQHPNHSAYQYSNSGDDGDFPSTQRPPNPSLLSYASPNPTTTQNPIPPPSLSNTQQLLHQFHPSLSPSHPRLQFPPHTTLQKSEGSDLGQERGRAREEWTRERKELTHFHKMVCLAVTEPTIPHTDINFFIAQQCLILAHSGLL